MSLESNVFLKHAVIVCEHIAKNGCPILSAFKTSPDSLEDSGWQFFCGKVEDEDPTNAQVWLIEEILEFEPSLKKHLELKADVHIWRTNINEDWQVRKWEE